jgi:heat shock protein HslJ
MLWTALLLVLAGSVRAQTPADLGATSWQLVKFQSSDGSTLSPDDRAKYTVTFGVDGSASVRIDCNRGRATWKSPGPNQLVFSPLALTRAMCPPAPLNDRIPRDWELVRSYILKEGHLFLSLAAHGGTYEFEPTSRVEAGTSRGSTTVPLENTHWKLTSLDGTPLTPDNWQEPYLVLSSESRQVAGSGGCNRFTGAYELNGDVLTFRQVAITMMACLKGMTTEQAFMKTLAEVKTWKIVGEQLELFASDAHLAARLEAVRTK